MSEFRIFCIGAMIAYGFLFLGVNLSGHEPRDGAATVIMVMLIGGASAVALFGRRA